MINTSFNTPIQQTPYYTSSGHTVALEPDIQNGSIVFTITKSGRTLTTTAALLYNQDTEMLKNLPVEEQLKTIHGIIQGKFERGFGPNIDVVTIEGIDTVVIGLGLNGGGRLFAMAASAGLVVLGGALAVTGVGTIPGALLVGAGASGGVWSYQQKDTTITAGGYAVAATKGAVVSLATAATSGLATPVLGTIGAGIASGTTGCATNLALKKISGENISDNIVTEVAIAAVTGGIGSGASAAAKSILPNVSPLIVNTCASMSSSGAAKVVDNASRGKPYTEGVAESVIVAGAIGFASEAGKTLARPSTQAAVSSSSDPKTPTNEEKNDFNRVLNKLQTNNGKIDSLTVDGKPVTLDQAAQSFANGKVVVVNSGFGQSIIAKGPLPQTGAPVLRDARPELSAKAEADALKDPYTDPDRITERFCKHLKNFAEATGNDDITFTVDGKPVSQEAALQAKIDGKTVGFCNSDGDMRLVNNRLAPFQPYIPGKGVIYKKHPTPEDISDDEPDDSDPINDPDEPDMGRFVAGAILYGTAAGFVVHTIAQAIPAPLMPPRGEEED